MGQSSDCERFESLISEAFDRSLSEEPLGDLKEHLERCLSCRGFQRDLEQMTSLLDSEEEPSQERWRSLDRLWNRVESEIGGKAPAHRTGGFWKIAAGLLIGVLSYAVGRYHQPGALHRQPLAPVAKQPSPTLMDPPPILREVSSKVVMAFLCPGPQGPEDTLLFEMGRLVESQFVHSEN